MLCAVRTSHLIPQEIFPVHISVGGLVDCGRKDYVVKNSNDTIGNRTRDVPACSAVPQPTAPPRARVCVCVYIATLTCVVHKL